MRALLVILLAALTLAPAVGALEFPVAPAGPPCTGLIDLEGCKAWSALAAAPPNTAFTGAIARASAATTYTIGTLRGPGAHVNFAGTHLRALDAETGAQRWAILDADRTAGGITTYGDDLAHFTYDMDDGAAYVELRSGATGAIMSSTLVPSALPILPGYLAFHEGLLYGAAWIDHPRPAPGALPITDVLVFALDPASGEFAWIKAVDIARFDTPMPLMFLDGDLYVPITASWPTTSVVLRLDALDGGEVWRSTVTSFDGLGFFPSRSVAFTRADGEPVLAFTGGSSGQWFSDTECIVEITFSLRRLCTHPENAWVWLLSARTGETLWTREWHQSTPQLDPDANPLADVPSSVDGLAATADGAGLLVEGSSGRDLNGQQDPLLMRLDASTGEPVWTQIGDHVVAGTPTLNADGSKVITFGQGLRIQLRDVETGLLLWQVDQAPCDPITTCQATGLLVAQGSTRAYAVALASNGRNVEDESGSMPSHDLVTTSFRFG